MNDNILALIGVAIILICALITYSKKVPRWLPFATIPMIICIISGFRASDISEWVNIGAQGIVSNVLVAIFALLFFNLLRATGVFDIIVHYLLDKIRGNIYLVYMIAILLGAIGQMDSSAVTTFFIAVPPLVPLFDEMHLDRKKMLLAVCLGAAPMNMLPWGTPTSVAAYSLEVDTVQMTRHLLPVFVIAYVLVVAVVMSCFAYPDWKRSRKDTEERTKAWKGMEPSFLLDKPLARPKNFLINVLVFLSCIASLFMLTTIKAYILFAIGSGILIVLNYKTDEVSEIMGDVSLDILNVILMLFCVSFMTGILRNSGIIESIGMIVIEALPYSMARYLAVIWAWLRPILDCFIPWQTWGAIPPLLVSIGAGAGLNGYQVLGATCISCFGIPCSPLVVPSLIGCRLADVEFFDQQKFSAIYNFGLNFALLVIAVLLNIA